MNRLYGYVPVFKDYAPESMAATPAHIVARKRALRGGPISLRADTFDQYVGGANLPVVVNFWARWCSLSKAMAPHFATGARKLAGRAMFATVEKDEEASLATRYGIECVPTLIVLRNGQEIERHCGAMTAGRLAVWLAPLLRKTI
ncbi:thioredoxin family protein [Caballeronia sordidicola]|uniref:thioredoxin family protein n=1 Tax=Caballeronia sordidicola TaxID=196367 RepID=UPI000A360C11